MPFSNANNQKTLILKLLSTLPELGESIQVFESGEVILEEGKSNGCLYILVEGDARLSKKDGKGHVVEVDAFSSGSLLGLTSFWMRQPVFATINALSRVSCIRIDRDYFESVVPRYPELVNIIQSLFVSNLSDRYRNLIGSHVERAKLSRQLKHEHSQLKAALAQLEKTTNRLINQEKLAMLGQLIAGVAHEINNPAGALLRDIETAKDALEEIFNERFDEDEAMVLREGLASPIWSSNEKRDRMDRILRKVPGISRNLARRYAQLTDIAEKRVFDSVGDDARKLRLVRLFELGARFRGAGIAAERISHIVVGLKNYGGSVSTIGAKSNLVDGIKDTLTVLNNRLRHYEVQLDLNELPEIFCNQGEINQVWTNLLVNAMDATPAGQPILITCRVKEGCAVICIEDSGTGIAENKWKTVFEANYTTKNQSGSFGLGLGLSISKDIVEKHGGTIEAGKSEFLGGARFRVKLPIGESD